MKAAVLYEPGGPEVLKLESRPIPEAQPGEVLIRVEAFGLNRSELFTRQGYSPGVSFPRILGIEAVGVVELHRVVSSNGVKPSPRLWAVWAGDR